MPEHDKQVDLDDLDKKESEETLEVPLDEEGNIVSEEQKKANEESERKEQEERSRKNAEAAQRRIDQEKRKLREKNEALERELAEARKSAPAPRFGVNQPMDRNSSYWEKRLAENPVEALTEHYKHMRQQEREEEARVEERRQMAESYTRALNESSEMAYEEIPALKDETSEEYATFMSLLDQNPEWRNSPVGPMKIVRKMKKLAQESGNDFVSRVEARGASEERNRQARIASQPLSGGRTTEKPKSVVLTKDQLQYCRDNNIKPEEFAKYTISLGKGEGVSV